MILSGTAKSNKSWCLLDLGLSVACGKEWWGMQCEQSRVIYINFELPRWAVAERLTALRMARPELKVPREHFAVWNLRGYSADLALLRPQLEEKLGKERYGLVILDPAYKLLGDRDENSNGEIAEMMNQLELVVQSSGSAVVLAHHFAKGEAGMKEAMDRMSGAGAWARDPDALVVLTPHEEEDCFTVSTILRHMRRIPEWVVQWDYPLMRMAKDLNPEALRSRMGRKRVYRDAEFQRIMLTKPKSREAIVKDGAAMGLSERSVSRYLCRLVEAGAVAKGNGMYWVKEGQ
jgi:RecA-family ATPase